MPDETEIQILSEDQIATILHALEGRTLRPIVAFLLGTGARRGEALALRWKDVNFDTGVIRIERSLEQTKAGLRFKAPKTKNGRRNVSIPPWLVAELRAHRIRQQERRLALGLGRAPEDSLVFARWDGGTRSPHWLTQKFALRMDALKIDCSLHGLRHTHVSQLIAAGMDVLTISRRIGHASPTSLSASTVTCSRTRMPVLPRSWRRRSPKSASRASRWQSGGKLGRNWR